MDFPMRKELKEYNRLYKELNNIYHDIALKLGLSDSAFDIFYAIAEFGDGCTQRDICQMTFISKQTINSSIRKLKKDEYILLKKGVGRHMHIYLTPSGAALLKERILPAIEIENRTFCDMTAEECTDFLRLTAKYTSILRENAKLLLPENITGEIQ